MWYIIPVENFKVSQECWQQILPKDVRVACLTDEENQEQEKLLGKKEAESQGDDDKSDQSENEESEYIAPAYDEIVPVINLISDKLTEANK